MIGWHLLKNRADLDALAQDLEVEPKPIAWTYPCWVFEHANYDESTGLEVVERADLERMLAALLNARYPTD